MSEVWTNKIASSRVTKQLDGFAHDNAGGKADWGGETSYQFPSVERREAFFVAAKAAGFDLKTGLSAG
jgi:hypothetical protein